MGTRTLIDQLWSKTWVSIFVIILKVKDQANCWLFGDFMVLSKEQIKNAAMQLGPAEREALAEELLLSLGDVEREAIDSAWLAEAKRRDGDFVAGKNGAKPSPDVVDRLNCGPDQRASFIIRP